MVTSSFAPRRPPTTPSPTTASVAQLLAGIAGTSASGSLQIANNLSDVASVTTSRANLGMFFNADSLWGNPTTASGTATYVTVGTGLAFSGGALVCTVTGGTGGVGTVTRVDTGTGLAGGPITTAGTVSITTNGVTTDLITASAVTYPKVQNVTASALLGNPTTASATVSEITLGTGLAFSGSQLVNTVTSGGGSTTNSQYPFLTGLFYSSPWGGDNNRTFTANTIYLTPFAVTNAGGTISQGAVWVSSAASAGKKLEMMIYRDNAGTPAGGALELDFGAVLCDSIGAATITASHALATGRYWLGLASDGTPQIRGTSLNVAAAVYSQMVGFTDTVGDIRMGHTASWTFSAGAAPGTCPATSSTETGNLPMPLLYLKF